MREIIEYFYKQEIKPNLYIPRKLILPDEHKIHIFGSFGVGKSSFIRNYLGDIKEDEYLYIDFLDPKLYFLEINFADIFAFIDEKNIKIVVFDHIDAHQEELLNYSNLISNEKLKIIIINNNSKPLADFHSIELLSFDYEEFLLSQKKSESEHLFGIYLKKGSLPQIATSLDNYWALNHFVKEHFNAQESKLLTLLASLNTRFITTFQIYNLAKSHFKTSKDSIYKEVERFETTKIIRFIPDISSPNKKKIILCDFVLAKHLSLKHSFFTQFDNIIALHLFFMKLHFHAFGQTGYLIEKSHELILPMPFESIESSWKKCYNRFGDYKKFGVSKIWIITVTNQYDFKLNDIDVEAIPFHEWAILEM
jgi:predicted AAA+ superfamily ATPase